MKRLQKVLIDFVYFTDAVLVQFVQAVILALTGNTNFPTPQPTLAALTTALTDFQDAISAAEIGNSTDRATRDEKREELLTLMRQLALYVQLISGDNVAMMLSSGLHVSKLPSPFGPLPKPVKFQVISKNKGMLQLSLERIIGATSYLYQYRLVTEMEWKNVIASKTKITLMDLERGKEYVCRVLPSGASEIKVYSNEESSYVL